MIAYLSGKLAEKFPDHVIIECKGIGYHVRISLNTFSKLGSDEKVKLHTHFMVKEDAHELFGFSDINEKLLFLDLISVSGVGGNTALTILSSIQPKELERIIESENVDLLKRIKGIGPKTAARIILELKGKLKLTGDSPGGTVSSPVRNEALAALTNLGFSRAVMEKRVDEILSKAEGNISLEEIIRIALKGGN